MARDKKAEKAAEKKREELERWGPEDRTCMIAPRMSNRRREQPPYCRRTGIWHFLVSPRRFR